MVSPPTVGKRSRPDSASHHCWAINFLFADDIRLEEMLNVGSHNWRIVTSQPDIPGRAADFDEIELAMKELGFVLLPWRGIGYDRSMAFQRGAHAIWDCHPGNFVRTPDGVVVPIDV